MFVTWLWALGLIRNILRSRKCSSLGHWRLDSSGASCVPGNTRHLAIGTWTHPERLAFREMFVTWPLALGLIRSVLHSGKCSLLDHWHLDSSERLRTEKNVRHLAFWHLGLIRGVIHYQGKMARTLLCDSTRVVANP
ncbi:hypothetical protein Tco_0277657 [Tanacetum coccineum]